MVIMVMVVEQRLPSRMQHRCMRKKEPLIFHAWASVHKRPEYVSTEGKKMRNKQGSLVFSVTESLMLDLEWKFEQPIQVNRCKSCRNTKAVQNSPRTFIRSSYESSRSSSGLVGFTDSSVRE